MQLEPFLRRCLFYLLISKAHGSYACCRHGRVLRTRVGSVIAVCAFFFSRYGGGLGKTRHLFSGSTIELHPPFDFYLAIGRMMGFEPTTHLSCCKSLRSALLIALSAQESNAHKAHIHPTKVFGSCWGVIQGNSFRNISSSNQTNARKM